MVHVVGVLGERLPQQLALRRIVGCPESAQIGGVMFPLSGVRMIHVNTRWVWPFVLIGVGIAFHTRGGSGDTPRWRFATEQRCKEC